jgi:hypothetical protein
LTLLQCHAECLAVQPMPHNELRFAPGCAPTPLLLGTLEALLRTDGPKQALLATAAAFVRATLAWLQAALRASAEQALADAQQAGACGSSSSTTSSSSSSSSSSSRDRGSSAQGQGGSKAQEISDVLTALPGLVVAMRQALQSHPWRQKLTHNGVSALPCCCDVAVNLLHLTARHLAVPRAAALPVMRLAVAAQQLTATCAGVSHMVFTTWLPATVDSAPAAGGTGQQQQQQESQSSSTSPCRKQTVDLRRMLPVLRAMQGGVAALQRVHPWWEQGQEQWDGKQGGSTQPGVGAVKALEEGSSSSSSTKAGEAEDADAAAVLALAASIQHACRTRVQLVGCSNSHCTSQSSPSVGGLVVGRKGVRCGGCRVARYCSPACQQADWPQHRHVCRRLAAAAPEVVGRSRTAEGTA